jgi:hypothetical protein
MGFSNAIIDQEIERYAWFPVRTASKKWIWRTKYYSILRFHNTETTRVGFTIKRLTEHEYLMYLLTKPEPYRPNPPRGGSALIPKQKPLTRR